MSSRVIVQPPAEPLTLEQIKLYHAVDHDLHDALLTSLIKAARRYVENNCGISLVTQTREASFNEFGTYLTLDHGPIQSVLSVAYVDSAGEDAELTDTEYVVDLALWRIAPVYGTFWPTIQDGYNAVTVSYIAGFTPVEGSPTDYVSSIPEDITTAMQLLIGNWYENRESSIIGTITSVLELGVKELLSPYRRRRGIA